jgi:hypothetical protein
MLLLHFPSSLPTVEGRANGLVKSGQAANPSQNRLRKLRSVLMEHVFREFCAERIGHC